MHRCLHRLGLSLLLTIGVIAWNHQQSHSFSQTVPLFFPSTPGIPNPSQLLEADVQHPSQGHTMPELAQPQDNPIILNLLNLIQATQP